MDVVGTTTHNVFEGTKGPGNHVVSFDIPNLPDGKTFTKVRATWTVDGASAVDEFELRFAFKVLGTYLHSRYNIPDESTSACGTGSQNVNFTGPGDCTLISNCNFQVETAKPTWVSEVGENGSGLRSNGDWVTSEDSIECSSVPTPKLRTLNTSDGCPACQGMGLQDDGTVAVKVNHPDLDCGDIVYVHTIGVRKVTDTGGGLATAQLDHFSGPGACNAVVHIGMHKTLELFQ